MGSKETGAIPPISNMLPSKIKRNGDQIMVRAFPVVVVVEVAGVEVGEQQTQQSVILKELDTVWESLTRAFSLGKNALGRF